MYRIIVQLKSYFCNMRVIIHKFTSVRESEGENERAQYIICVNIRTKIHVYTFISRSMSPIFIYADINNEITTVTSDSTSGSSVTNVEAENPQDERERDRKRGRNIHTHIRAHTVRKRERGARFRRDCTLSTAIRDP